MRSLEDAGGDRRIAIDCTGVDLGALAAGASIAVNGVCLTVTEFDSASFAADVSRETLAVTTLGSLARGARVNLEPALKVGDRLDGHFVAGHVDATARVAAVSAAARSVAIRFELPEALARYVAPKGSIAVDGVSLTVNAVGALDFEVNVVPHTQSVTVIGGYAPGTAVNLEVDIIARYLERLNPGAASRGEPAPVDLEVPRRHGYAREE